MSKAQRDEVVEAVVRWHRTRRHVIEHPVWDTNEHAKHDCDEMEAAQKALQVLAAKLSMEEVP